MTRLVLIDGTIWSSGPEQSDYLVPARGT
jgi:hypothetical protein